MSICENPPCLYGGLEFMKLNVREIITEHIENMPNSEICQHKGYRSSKAEPPCLYTIDLGDCVLSITIK